MRLRYWLVTAGWMLMTAMACGQTNQQPSTAQATGVQATGSQTANSQPANSQPANPPPANPKPIKQSAVAAAASASRLARESAPPSKVIRNHDLSSGNNPPETAKSEPKPDEAAAKAAADKADQQDRRKVEQFEAQGKIFQNQIKVEKGKIIGIQNHITSLKNQFAAWSAQFSQDPDAQACWTSTYYSPYYKDWCDTGRNLKAQYEASQRQLDQEKTRLEQMQEDIRRKGYGNSVYDPD
jgi:hypothetical protein